MGSARSRAMGLFALAGLLGLLAVAARIGGRPPVPPTHMGRQPDGGFLVSSGQRVSRRLDRVRRPADRPGRPSPRPGLRRAGPARGVPGRREGRPAGDVGPPGLRDRRRVPRAGLVARRLAALRQHRPGFIRVFAYKGGKLSSRAEIPVQPRRARGNPVPGGMAITRDGTRLFVAAANLNAVVEIDLATPRLVREYPVQNLPFEPRLSEDERTLIVSNWGGRLAAGRRPDGQEPGPRHRRRRARDAGLRHGQPDRPRARRDAARRGRHPPDGHRRRRRPSVRRQRDERLDLRDRHRRRHGHADDPDALGRAPACSAACPTPWRSAASTLYVADGGDNALAEIDLLRAGPRLPPRRLFPHRRRARPRRQDGLRAQHQGQRLGEQDVARQAGQRPRLPGDRHRRRPLDRPRPRDRSSSRATTAGTPTPAGPPLKVYNGAIRHVLYIIKENRTYDEVFGDLPQGNGDPKLCSLGETVMPNHRKIAREFTLFDNGYVSGTNSADGHAWSTQSLANDYLEHFYVGYSRTYPCDGDDPMAISNAGALWDAALGEGQDASASGASSATTSSRDRARAEGLVRGLGGPRSRGRTNSSSPPSTDVASLEPLHQPRGLLLAAAPERPVPRRRLHPRV